MIKSLLHKYIDYAKEHNSLTELEEYIRSFPDDVNQKIKDKYPLQLAFANNDILKLLLDNGATPNIPLTSYDLGQIIYGERAVDCIRTLIEYGTDVNLVVEDTGETALHVCYRYDISVMKMLLEYKIDPNIRNSSNQTVLSKIVLNRDCVSDVVGKIKLLLDNGADPNFEVLDGRTIFAAMLREPMNFEYEFEIFKLLLERVQDVDRTEHIGYTPLMRIIEHYGNRYVSSLAIGPSYSETVSTTPYPIPYVQALLDAGANINKRSSHGRTPLMMACMECKPSIVNYLLSRGADASILDNEGNSCFDMLVSGKKKEVMNILIREEKKRWRKELLSDVYALLCLEKSDVPNEIKLEIMKQV